MSEYVEVRDGGYYAAGARVSLDSVVYAFRGGESPETIQFNRTFRRSHWSRFTGAIALYLGRQAEIDASIRQGEEEAHRVAPPLSPRKLEAYARLQRAHPASTSRPRKAPISMAR